MPNAADAEIRTLALIKRHPDITRDEFRAHYEEIHVPLALPNLDGLLRYVRHHVDAELLDPPGFDVLTAFWYRDKASTDRVFSWAAGPGGEAIRADELTFMDKLANRYFPVSERRWLEGEEGDHHVWVLVKRPDGMSRSSASMYVVDEAWPRLFAQNEEVGFALLRDGFPMGEDDPPWDSVMQIAAPAIDGLERWAKDLGSEGFAVNAVHTRSFETDLSAR